MQTIRKKRLSGKKPMKQGLRVIQCMSEYRIIKERNLHGSQSGLHTEKTKGQDKGVYRKRSLEKLNELTEEEFAGRSFEPAEK